MNQRQRRRRERRRKEAERRGPSKRQVTAGATIAMGASLVATGSVQAATFTVSNLNDEGSGSLRQAILDANQNGIGSDDIVFASGLTGTINVGSTAGNGLYALTAMNIQGPGADKITLQGDSASIDYVVYTGTDASFYGASAGDPVSLSGLTITGGNATGKVNAAYTIGGGIWNQDFSLSVSNAVISGNYAYTDGAGIYVYDGSLQVDSSTISGNTAHSAGGGVYFHQTSAPSAIRNSTISGNSTQTSFDDGGGVYINDDNPTQSILIANTTITGNTVGDHGGGIYDFSYTNPGQSSLTVRSSTITGNSSGNQGGGIFNQYATTIQNTILANNTSSDNSDLSFSTDPANVAFSLVKNFAQPFNQTGPNILGQDPQLGGLASNGGPTQTELPAATSPVIDKGNAFGLNSDQRGVLRPIDFPAIPNAGDGSDIGAVELQPSNAFKLGKLKRNKKKGTAKQVVILPTPDAGTVTIKGNGLKSKTRKVTGAAKVKLPVIAKGKKRKGLNASGKAKIKAKVTYSPTGNVAKTLKRKLKLLKR
jgi:hypothetical protein